jgi:transposase
MSLEESVVQLPDFVVEEISFRQPIVIRVRYTGLVRCPKCQGTALRLKDSWTRRVRHHPIGDKLTVLEFRTGKYRCPCGRHFHPRYPGILLYQRASESLRQHVGKKHHDGLCQSVLGRTLAMSWATVERYYRHFLGRKAAEVEGNPAPRVLGIDEHFFTKKQGFATTLANLSSHKVHDVVLGRSEASLGPYLEKMAARWRTRVVLMDLSETYRSIVRRYFENALVVADRFHVIRLINHHFMDAWKGIDPVGRKSRGLISLMRRHPENLKPEQVPKLRSYLRDFPVLERLYDFKQELTALMRIKKVTAKVAKRKIPDLLFAIECLKDTPIATLQTLGATLDSWKNEIVRMWRFTKTNSITEGLHNKMELISRRAYGFRNFQNYRLRVKALCG